ncbi:MAG: response regulator transcription factor [Verrucomicrobiae bacterium]|nr:response regulator transcription factor [Verrucomicrobiae bacterium]
MKVLLVEDEPALREGLLDLLRGAGHQVQAAADGMTGLKLALDGDAELLVLDLMLPKLDGLEVCRKLRRSRPELPILMLTARGSEEDKVKGLKLGADDYLTKPFGPRELLARIEALARRAKKSPSESEIVEVDGCSLDLGRCQGARGKSQFTLTGKEAAILRWLHRHKARAVPRAELLEQVWGTRGDLETRTVDMTIANLRQKIERDPEQPAIVVSVKGVGYAWGNPK